MKYQLIRSIKPIRGYESYYYYCTISEECFSKSFAAIKRKIAIPEDDKDYRLVKVVDDCARIVPASAKMDTFNEQPRIFKLFNEYMDRKSHNKAN